MGTMFIGINRPLEVNGVQGQHWRSRVVHRDYVTDLRSAAKTVG